VRVIVLNAGRCGSLTVARAASHVTNYTAGHESRIGKLDRFAYPDWHLEADNRLSWFLGSLPFDPEATVYVHLRRDLEATARSHLARWQPPRLSRRLRGVVRDQPTRPIIDGFAHSILMGGRWEGPQRLEVARLYVQTVTDNIAAFVADKPLSVDLRIDALDADAVDRLWAIAQMEGDPSAFTAALSETHNARV
jgi:hypothetical protein